MQGPDRVSKTPASLRRRAVQLAALCKEPSSHLLVPSTSAYIMSELLPAQSLVLTLEHGMHGVGRQQDEPVQPGHGVLLDTPDRSLLFQLVGQQLGGLLGRLLD